MKLRWPTALVKNWPFIVPFVLLGLCVYAIILLPGRAYVSVPAEACKASYTGRSQDASYVMQQCYAFDKNGVCTMNVPQTVQATAREVSVQCNYVEWRTE